ncbi:MAG: class I tRNA ligase family protein, partial [Brachybacterium sp.]
MVYPVTGDPLVSSPNLPSLENAIQEFWRTDDTFRASIAQREGAEEFVFYDGPPFANGLPHYGHLLTGFVKDVVPRFRTMCGNKVDRRFGWDTHGLPAEL